jgi:uncharacterized membrane protein YagU involved in acid resistance
VAFARAGLLTAVVDGLFSSVLSVAFYGSTATRLFQGVASTLLGTDAVNGGARAAAVGVAMHVGVAFAWSAVFLAIARASPRVRRAVVSRQGQCAVASVYGPLIWLVMSCAVIPLLTHRPTAITIRWWVQLIGHVPFVGLPIVATIGGRDSP